MGAFMTTENQRETGFSQWGDFRYVTEPHPEDGSWTEAKLTEEGVIVDGYNRDGDLIGTFARTYDEFMDGFFAAIVR
jgi:hypothetical protein